MKVSKFVLVNSWFDIIFIENILEYGVPMIGIVASYFIFYNKRKDNEINPYIFLKI